MIWLHVPADAGDTVDPGWELRTDAYEDTGIAIQDARGYCAGLCVTVLGPSIERPEWIEHHPARDLDDAKRIALDLYQKREAAP